MYGCSILPEAKFVGTHMRVDSTQVLSVGSSPPMVAAREMPEFSIKPSLGAPLAIFPLGYLLKSFPQGDTSTRLWGFEIRVFLLLGELPRTIASHLPVFRL